MIRFSVGGFYGHYRPLVTLLLLREEHPEWFREGVMVDSTFDSWPNVPWNGGRIRFDNPYPIREMEKNIRFFNGRGIGIRFTYTNLLLGPEHLGDVLGNRTLELANDPLNAVIVASPVLEAYVRERYPKFKIIGSCTTDLRNPAALAARAQELDLIVLPPDLNHHPSLVEQLGPARVEILVNERCKACCGDRKLHYHNISRAVLDQELAAQRDPTLTLPQACVFRVGTPAWRQREGAAVKYPLYLSFPEIEALHRRGVEHFKLAGRDVAFPVLLADFARFLVQEEHQAEFSFAFLELLHDGRAFRWASGAAAA